MVTMLSTLVSHVAKAGMADSFPGALPETIEACHQLIGELAASQSALLARLAESMLGTHDQVTFPMPHLLTILNFSWPLADRRSVYICSRRSGLPYRFLRRI